MILPTRGMLKQRLRGAILVALTVIPGCAGAIPTENVVSNSATSDIIALLNGEHGEVVFESIHTTGGPQTAKNSALITPLIPLGFAPVQASDTVTLFYRPLGFITQEQLAGYSSQNTPRRLILLSPSAQQAIERLFPDAEILVSRSMPDALRQLRSGAVDGIIASALTIDIYMSVPSSPPLRFRMLPELKVAYGFRIINATPDLMRKVTQQVAQFPSSYYRALSDRRELIAVISGREKDTKYLWNYVVGTLLVCLVVILLILVQVLYSKRTTTRRLKDATVFWETLIESIPTPVVVCTADGIISHCNRAFLESLHIAKEDVLLKSISILNNDFKLTPPLTPSSLVSALMADGPVFREGTIIAENKEAELLQWTSKYHGADGVPRGIVIGWTDISNRKQLEEKLAVALGEANKASEEKSRFLARMSHEIRSPLNVILGALDMEMEPKNGPQPSMLPVANSAAIHLLDIVGQVLDLSKIEAGEMRLNMKPADLAEWLRETCINYRFIAERKGLVFYADFNAISGKSYLCDKTKIIQTVSNLLSNAIKYTDSGHVKVSAEIEDSHSGIETIVIIVSDTGQGIPPGKIANMLEPYTQAGDSLPGSTGLGLNIVQQFVNLMGAVLSVESRVGEGSVFRLHVPLQYSLKPTIDVELPEPAAVAVTTGMTILLVDDSPSGLTIIAMQLRSFGHSVVTATDGDEALKVLAGMERVDLIITDCNMPVMDGYTFSRYVRNKEEGSLVHHRILGVTANAFTDEEVKCLSAGMDVVLIKPFRADTLERTIRSLSQGLMIDMEEVDILTAGSPELRTRFLNEILGGARAELNEILGITENTESISLRDTVHRLKGVYAFAGFRRGLEACEEIEWMLKHNEKDVMLAILRLKQANYHFDKLIENELVEVE